MNGLGATVNTVGLYDGQRMVGNSVGIKVGYNKENKVLLAGWLIEYDKMFSRSHQR